VEFLFCKGGVMMETRTVTVTINGRPYHVKQGMTILETVNENTVSLTRKFVTRRSLALFKRATRASLKLTARFFAPAQR
jgi:UPF0288 family protein (methanogenesis marker protein 3)